VASQKTVIFVCIAVGTSISHSYIPFWATSVWRHMLGAGRDKMLVSFWTVSGEACRSVAQAMCRLVRAEQQDISKFVVKYLRNK
jgi:hypothetical protein